jgi:hypothetical protein
MQVWREQRLYWTRLYNKLEICRYRQRVTGDGANAHARMQARTYARINEFMAATEARVVSQQDDNLRSQVGRYVTNTITNIGLIIPAQPAVVTASTASGHATAIYTPIPGAGRGVVYNPTSTPAMRARHAAAASATPAQASAGDDIHMQHGTAPTCAYP